MTSPAILIVAPTKRELGGLREADALAALRKSERDEALIVRIALCGVGREAGERVAALLDAAPCSLLISLGFAGALDPDLSPGDLIIANAFLRLGDPPSAPISLQGERAGERVLEEQQRSADGAQNSSAPPQHPHPPPLAATSPLVGRGGGGIPAYAGMTGRFRKGLLQGERRLEERQRSADGAQNSSAVLQYPHPPPLAATSPLVGRGGGGIPAYAGMTGRFRKGLLQGERRLEERQRTTDGAHNPALAPSTLSRRFAATSPLVGRGEYANAGALLTVDAPLLTPAAKRRARAASGAAVVDMEGRRIAEAAAERGVPLIAVRAVLDEADLPLPRFAAEVAAAEGEGELRRVFRAAPNPGEFVGLLLLALRARKAAGSLRRAADAILSAPPERL